MMKPAEIAAEIATKTCSKCKLSKDATPGTGEFYSDKRSSDGLQRWCKTCIIASSAAWAAANPEYATAKRHYYSAHNTSRSEYSCYKDMTFHPEWDTAKGTPKAAATFARNAAAWMKLNCAKPGKGYQLHVLETQEHPYGYFGPGGIEWFPKADVHSHKALDTILKLPTQMLRDFRAIIDRELQRR